MTCCPTAVLAQQDITRSHKKLISDLSLMGYEVDLFAATYPCSNGKDFVVSDKNEIIM